MSDAEGDASQHGKRTQKAPKTPPHGKTLPLLAINLLHLFFLSPEPLSFLCFFSLLIFGFSWRFSIADSVGLSILPKKLICVSHLQLTVSH